MEDQMRMVSFPKRMWNIVRVYFFLVQKGICKRKLLLDLSLLLKRGKLAGKAALSNLMLHHNSTYQNLFSFFTSGPTGPTNEYEFSFSNTPAHPSFDHLLSHVISKRASKKKHQARYKAQYACIEEELAAVNTALMQVVMMGGPGPTEPVDNHVTGYYGSPVLPGLGFGRSPAVRQLRVTDSPFPVLTGKEEADCHVDRAADEFIKRFYSQLSRQSLIDA